MSVLERSEVRSEIASRVSTNLSSISLFLGLALIAVGGVHFVFLDGVEATWGATAFAATGLLLLAVRLLFVWWTPPASWTWTLVYLLSLLVFIPLYYNFLSFGSQRYYMYAFVLLAGTGTIFFDLRWLALLSVSGAVAWVTAASRHLEGTEWLDGIVAFLLAVAVAFTVQSVRLTTLERSARRKLLEERRREDLEQALADVERTSAEAVEKSVRDPLTGAYNRRYLEELEFSLKRPTAIWGVLVIDLDNFKDVNDRFGHEEGDRVLQGVAHFIGRYGRAEDQLIRFGGDEFVVLIDVKSDEEVRMVSERIREAAKRESPISLSVGHAVRRPGENLSEVIRRADEDMYRDKSRLRAVGGGPPVGDSRR